MHQLLVCKPNWWACASPIGEPSRFSEKGFPFAGREAASQKQQEQRAFPFPGQPTPPAKNNSLPPLLGTTSSADDGCDSGGGGDGDGEDVVGEEDGSSCGGELEALSTGPAEGDSLVLAGELVSGVNLLVKGSSSCGRHWRRVFQGEGPRRCLQISRLSGCRVAVSRPAWCATRRTAARPAWCATRRTAARTRRRGPTRRRSPERKHLCRHILSGISTISVMIIIILLYPPR